MLLNQKAAPAENFYVLTEPVAIDGDTLKVSIALGFGISKETILRLKGWYAPELGGDNPTAALAARDALQSFATAHRLTIRARGLRMDLHGRWVAVLLKEGRPVEPHQVLGVLQLTPDQHAQDLRAQKRNRSGGAFPL